MDPHATGAGDRKRPPVTLIAGKFGSRHFGTEPFLAEALASTGKDRPLALYIGAANGDDRTFGSLLSALLESAGARSVIWPKLSRGKKEHGAAHAALAEADLVFVGGGDVEAGMQALGNAGLIDAVHAAAERGAAFVGMSAGAIMLGARWIRWAHAGAGDDEAETYACLGLVPCSFDTHGEDDDWRETRSFASVRARETGMRARAYGIPSGGALMVAGDGTMTARGEPVVVFAASPNREVEMEEALEAAE